MGQMRLLRVPKTSPFGPHGMRNNLSIKGKENNYPPLSSSSIPTRSQLPIETKDQKMNCKTRELLTEYAAKYETADFLTGDPSWFMHQVEGPHNQEVMALIASCLSYGNRKLFMPKIQLFLKESRGNIYSWIKDNSFTVAIPDTPERFYRLQTYHHVHQLFMGIQDILIKHGSIGEFVKERATTAHDAITAMTRHFHLWDVGHLVPKSTTSSCKRVCMLLRWMVRDCSPVDLGLWTFIDKRTLIIPLDTHVMEEAKRLGLLATTQPSMRTAQKLTDELRKVFPDDPLKGDFALFGYGIQKAITT